MDERVSDVWVGAFVLVLGGVLLAAVLWLSAGLGSSKAMDDYRAVIQESVAGLSVDAPVKVLGVDVGKVSLIEIDPQNPQQVRLNLRLAHGTPIKRDTVAVLKTQGLTGIAYVELSGGSAAALPLLAGADGTPPTIPFKQSLVARLENVLTHVLTNVDRVTAKVDTVFDADNSAALKAMLADMAALAHTLAGQQAVLRAGLGDAARTARLAAAAGGRLAPTLDRIAAGARAVEQMAGSADAASRQAGLAAEAAAGSLQQISSETVPEMERLMEELGALSGSLRRLSEQTTASPGSLLLGAPPPRPGPGESKPP